MHHDRTWTTSGTGPMTTSGQINQRRLTYTTAASVMALLAVAFSAAYLGGHDHRPATTGADPAQATMLAAGPESAADEFGGQQTPVESDRASADMEETADSQEHRAGESPVSGESAAAPLVAAVEKMAAKLPVRPVVATVATASQAAAPLATTVYQPTRSRNDNGVVFAGQSDQIAQVKAQMSALLAQMGWNANQVIVRESAGGERIAYALNSAPGDTNTFVLSRQPQLGIGPEMITYTSRLGQKKTLALVSQKEILATMLQPGRAFVFSGPLCKVETLKEQLALRQNVVYWGLRADWVFPEDKIYRYNTGDYWQVMQGDDWTLKPGIRVSQAIADAFVGKFSYQIGCTSACRFIFTHGILDFYRAVQPNPAAVTRLEQALDPRRPFVDIAPTVDRNRVVVKEGRLMERHTDVPWNHWVPGDWGWIKNPDDKSSEELGSEGCNIIYAGGGFFVNYYPERPPKTLEQAIKRVYGWRFGLEESELDLPADLMQQLYQDPRSGGMLRDVRDYPRQFGIVAPAQSGA